LVELRTVAEPAPITREAIAPVGVSDKPLDDEGIAGEIDTVEPEAVELAVVEEGVCWYLFRLLKKICSDIGNSEEGMGTGKGGGKGTYRV